MPDLKHPATGEHIRASVATAERLIKDGWELVGGAKAAKADATPKATKAATPKTESGKTEPTKTEGTPLDKMKLTELITHAEKLGIAADDLAPLRKPGASKKQAIEIITAHAAA